MDSKHTSSNSEGYFVVKKRWALRFLITKSDSDYVRRIRLILFKAKNSSLIRFRSVLIEFAKPNSSLKCISNKIKFICNYNDYDYSIRLITSSKHAQNLIKM